MKILSPAGNFESLKTAIYNGADEVYLGINDFNARNNIDGFTLATLKDAVDFAHVYGVKVLLAINILFSDNEMQTALDTVVDAYNLGVDAFIIQDLGLARLVHDNYHEIEIHASTQMGLHNLEGVREIEKYGFKRVVLARETPLEEIKRIKENSCVEIEYFAQGALCVAFSGNCYLSSYLHKASGNRGKCKQLCRLPYTLQKDGRDIKEGYLISAKDFNMIDRLDDLKNAGVDVIKIEGRARRPEYVGLVTYEYYKALHNKKINIDNICLAFNRGFTAGYFDGNGDIISDYNNHIGIKVGKIEKVNKGKNFNEIIISSKRILYPKSTFKTFKDNVEQNTFTAYDLKEIAKGKYRITTTQKLSTGDNLHLILDSKTEEEILKITKKQKLNIKIFAQSEKPIKGIIECRNVRFEIFGDICECAIKQPLTKDEIEKNFAKNDLFEANIEFVVFDSIFLTKQKLNDFRRKVYDKALDQMTKIYRHNLSKVKIQNDYSVKKFDDFEIVENPNTKTLSKNIIYSPEIYNLEDIQSFKKKCQQVGKTLYLDTPNFALQSDIDLIKEIVGKTQVGLIANNYYALSYNTKTIAGAGLNIYNCYTASTFDLPVITAESPISTRINYPYMTLRHCPMKSNLNANCANCPYTKGYTYKMEGGKTMKLKRKKLSTCTFYLTD